MDFGRPDDPSAVDWRLDGDSSLTQLSLKRFAHERGADTSAHLYIGSTAWGPKEFVGPVYPTGTKAGDFLRAYAAQFNTIELNTTYYRTPDHRQVMKWYAATPDDFRFCPKVNKAISQASDLGVHTSRTLDFAKAVQVFEHKLGPCFVQLPPTFGTDRADALRAWLDQWPPQLRLAVELRHESWFSEGAGLDLFAELYERGVGAVITDVGGRRDVAHMHITAPFVLLRWVGTLHDSDGARLEAWASRLAAWMRAGVREAYVFTHEPEPVPSARAAASLVRHVRAHGLAGLRTRGPVLREGAGAAPPPSQRELFGS